MGANRVLVVALRPEPHEASRRSIESQRIEDYASPWFLFGKILNALLLDRLDTDLARMHHMNEVLADGEKAFGPDFQRKLNAVSGRSGYRALRSIRDVVIRPSADLGMLAGQILADLPEGRIQWPLARLAARSLSDDGHSAEADLLSYLLFDAEFLGPLTDLGYADARAREEDLCEFFTDPPARL